MDFEEFAQSAIESPTLEKLRASLAPYSVANIEYSCFHSFKFESQLSKAYARENIEPSQMLRMNYLYSGSRSVLKALFNYLKKHSEFDVDYFQRQTDKVQMYRPDLYNVKLQGMYDDFILANSYSTAYFFVESAGVVGAFYLYSPLTIKQSEKLLCCGELEPLLTAAHHQLYQEHKVQLNPWTNLGLLTPNALQILQQICNGAKLDEIAQNMKMTKRGVDYHLAHLKSIFEARSNCNLVAKAVALGAVEGTAINWESQ